MSDEIDIEPWALGMEQRDILFVREFLVDLNCYRAALDSGYYRGRSSTASTKAHSFAILRRTVILKAVTAAMEERASVLRITARNVLAECWRCYLEAAGDRNWSAAAKFLEMAGRHVDVRAFRDRFSPASMVEEEDVEAAGLKNLSLEELETLARLSRKAAGEPEGGPPPSSLRH